MSGTEVNALAETVNGYYKVELIYGPEKSPSETVDDVELGRWRGCTGTTPSASSAIAATFHHPSSRRPSLPNTPTNNWLECNSQSLQQTQSDS